MFRIKQHESGMNRGGMKMTDLEILFDNREAAIAFIREREADS